MFYSDKPIKYGTDDRLGRDKFAKELAQTLLAFNGRDTFTIGLSGKWGCGKTSLVNMTLSEIENLQRYNRELIVVRFEPWNFYDTNQLMTQFFTRLSNEFQTSRERALQTIGKAIIKYSGMLQLGKVIPGMDVVAEMVEQGTTQLEKALNETDVLKQKEEIITSLKKQDYRVVIVIDDIDRLSNEQIRCIFQLVASVANFPRITYLLVYDKEIVVHALEEVQQGRGEDYLEKIVQIPIEVVDIQRSRVLEVLDERVKEMVLQLEGAEIDEKYWYMIFQQCIAPFIKDLRDVNRLCNLARFKLSGIYKEVNICDMLALCALELFHPMIYQWVKTKKAELTGENDISRYNRNKGQQDWYDEYRKKLEGVLAAECGNKREIIELEQGGNKATEDIMDCLVVLFSHFGDKMGIYKRWYNSDWERRNNCISVGDKFERYFTLSIDGIEYTTQDVKDLVETMPKEEIIAFLLKQDNCHSLSELLQDIRPRISVTEEERAKIIIEALVETMHQFSSIWEGGSAYLVQFMLVELLGRIAQDKRAAFVVHLLSKAETVTLGPLASMIALLKHDRETKRDNGREWEYKGIICLTELTTLEDEFCKKTIELWEHNNLFDFYCWREIYDLLESVNETCAREHLQDALRCHENILKFLERFVNVLRSGREKRYKIEERYTDYMKKECIIDALGACRKDKSFYELDMNIQECAAAFSLKQSGYPLSESALGDNWILKEAVDAILAEWKAEDQVDTP